jgi:hypothetical protein
MGLFSGSPKPEPALVAGVSLRSEICKHERFYHRKSQVHGAVASFFDLEWLSPTADCYICAKCGYLHWFLDVSEGI